MKKLISILFVCVFIVLSGIAVFAASVPPQLFPGNDSNPNDYNPPEGCIHYEIPGSGSEGIFTARFDDEGNVDPSGGNIFNVTVGKETGKSYTEVLSWNSNFPVYAVIVKGGNAFNLYQYQSTVRADTNLVSPTNPSGNPADVSHVSIVICPDEINPDNGNGDGNNICNCIITILIIVALFVLFFAVGLIIGSLFFCKNERKGRSKCNN